MTKKSLTLSQGQGDCCTQKKGNPIYSKASNLNEMRALNALIKARERGISRKELDAVCASSNSPEIIRRLRRKGFVIHCEMRKTHNRFGEDVQAGYYRLMQEIEK